MPTRLLRQPSILQVSMIAHNWRLPWTIPQISYLQAELHIASMTLVLLHVQRWASTGWRIFVAKVQLLYNQCILRVKQLQSPTVLPSQWPAFSRSTKVFQRMDMLFERSQVEAKILELDPWRTNNLLHTKSKALLVNRKELWHVRQVIPPKKNTTVRIRLDVFNFLFSTRIPYLQWSIVITWFQDTTWFDPFDKIITPFLVLYFVRINYSILLGIHYIFLRMCNNRPIP